MFKSNFLKQIFKSYLRYKGSINIWEESMLYFSWSPHLLIIGLQTSPLFTGIIAVLKMHIPSLKWIYDFDSASDLFLVSYTGARLIFIESNSVLEIW